MSCLQTLAGIARECSNNMGGVDIIYLANREDVQNVSVGVDTGRIDAITMVSSKKFAAYHMKRETGSMSSSLQKANGGGTAYWLTDVTAVFPKMDAGKRAEAMALAIGELVAIVKDNNGVYWYLGHDFPVMASDGSSATGTAFADANGYTLTLQDTSLALPYTIDPEAVESVI